MRRTETIVLRSLFLAVVFVTALFFVAGLVLGRRRAFSAVERWGTTEVQLVQTNLNNLFASTELSLRFAATERESDIDVDTYFRENLLFIDHIANVGRYDADGNRVSMLRQSIPVPPDRLPQSVQETFALHKAEAATFITEEDSVIWFARRFPDGEIATAGIATAYIGRVFRLQLGQRTSAFLIDSQRRVIAASGPTDTTPSHLDEFYSTTTGLTLDVETHDRTVYAYMQLERYPLNLFLVYGPEVVLDEWRRQLPWQIGAFGFVVITLGAALYIAQRRQEALYLVREQALLVRETHHRVYNHLAMIESLFSLKANATDEGSQLPGRDDLRGRIRSISLIHEMLATTSDSNGVDFDRYCTRLLGEIATAFSSDVSFETKIDVEPILLPPDTARRLGLVIQETVNNALKHSAGSFGPSKVFTVSVTFRVEDEGWELIVADNGPGFPEAGTGAPPTGNGLGLMIIDSIAESMDATISRTNQDGARVHMSGAVSSLDR